MAIKFSQFNERTESTATLTLVGYDGNQNIRILAEDLFENPFISGTENTITMFGAGGTILADSIVSQNADANLLTVAGQLNIDAEATFDTSITVAGDSTLNGNVILGDESADIITQTGTLYLNGPVKDTTDTLGDADQILVSDASGELTFTDLANIAVGSAEVIEVPVKNAEGSPLTKGDPVYIWGSVGASGRLEVKLADASNAAKMPALGLLKQNLGINEEGFAVVTGKLRNLPTDPIDGQASSANDVIYVKSGGVTGAALTLTKPTGADLIQNMGKVGRVSTSNDGTFVVSSILRTNDIPNLTPGKIWVGSTGNTIESTIVDLSDSEELMTLEGTMEAQQVLVKGNSQPLILAKSTTPNAHITMRMDDEEPGFISSKSNHIGIGGNNGHSTDNLNIAKGNGYVGIKQKLPLAPLHIKSNGEAIRLESTGDNVCSIDFRQGTAKRGHLEFDNSVDTLEIKTTNPSGSESQIKFSTAIGYQTEAVERMRIRGRQVIINNPGSLGPSSELYVNGETQTTADLWVGLNARIALECRAGTFKVDGLNDAPATATSLGKQGEIRYTADYIYVCVSENNWKRTALTTW